MEYTDTVKLLRECDSGSKMAVSAIDEVTDKAKDSRLKAVLSESKQHHTKLGNEIHSMLLSHCSDEKDPNPMAKGMSWITTNFKMEVDRSDATIANLITDGCNMGVKSLYKYLNQYKAADKKSVDICKQLIDIEETLEKDMRGYL